MKKLCVYIAASSSEMDRARLAFDAIKAAPECELALDWIAQIETVGVANEGIPIVEGASYAAQSVLAVQACDVFVDRCRRRPRARVDIRVARGDARHARRERRASDPRSANAGATALAHAARKVEARQCQRER